MAYVYYAKDISKFKKMKHHSKTKHLLFILLCNSLHFFPIYLPAPIVFLLPLLSSLLFSQPVSPPSGIFLQLFSKYEIRSLSCCSCYSIPCCTKLTLGQAMALVSHSEAATSRSVDLVQQGMRCQLQK